MLELKNGRTNYILQYPNAVFVVFYDSTLRKMMLLNTVSHHESESSPYKTINKEERNANDHFKSAERYMRSLHPKETSC